MKKNDKKVDQYCSNCKYFYIYKNQYYQCKYFYEKKGYVMALSSPNCVACEKYTKKESD